MQLFGIQLTFKLRPYFLGINLLVFVEVKI